LPGLTERQSGRVSRAVFRSIHIDSRNEFAREQKPLATNGLAAASWLGTNGEWPEDHQSALDTIKMISGIDDDFLTHGITADEAAARLIAGLPYLRARLSSIHPGSFHDIFQLHL